MSWVVWRTAKESGWWSGEDRLKQSHKFSIFTFTYACLESVDDGEEFRFNPQLVLLWAVSFVMSLVVAFEACKKSYKRLSRVLDAADFLYLPISCSCTFFSFAHFQSTTSWKKLETFASRLLRALKVSCLAVWMCKSDEERNKKNTEKVYHSTSERGRREVRWHIL